MNRTTLDTILGIDAVETIVANHVSFRLERFVEP